MGGGGACGRGSLTQESSVVGHSSAPKALLLKSRSDPPEGSDQEVGPVCIGLDGKGHQAQDAISLSASVTYSTGFRSGDPNNLVLG